MGAPLSLPLKRKSCQTKCYPCDRFKVLPMCPVGQVNMPTSGIQYTYCPADPTPSCPGGGGYSNFTNSQITSMESAFSAWIGAKTDNGSNLSFNRVYTSIFEEDPFGLKILSASTTAMGIVLARMTTEQMDAVDYNNDGMTDATRLVGAIIEVRENVTSTTLTAVLTHELGHTFGLDDCPTCNDTTIMKTPLPSVPLSAPSACDNARVASIM